MTLRTSLVAASRLQGFSFALLCLRQALLKVVDPSALGLWQLAGDRGLGFGLRGLWTPAHSPPLALTLKAEDRLGERARVSKCADSRKPRQMGQDA
jgi:hypothetical protein